MRYAVLAFLLGSAAASAQLPVDPTPRIYLAGGAEAEGCAAQWATQAAVRAHSAPTPQSRPIRTIDADRRVDANDYSEAITVVLESGFARATRAVGFSGTRLGTGSVQPFRLSTGDVLTVVSEGPGESVTFAVDGAMYTGAVPGYGGGGGFEVVRRPVTEVWVRLVEHSADRPAAWLNTAQAGMVPREPFCP